MRTSPGREHSLPASTDPHEPLLAMTQRRDVLVLILNKMTVPLLAIQLFNWPNPHDVRVLRPSVGLSNPLAHVNPRFVIVVIAVNADNGRMTHDLVGFISHNSLQRQGKTNCHFGIWVRFVFFDVQHSMVAPACCLPGIQFIAHSACRGTLITGFDRTISFLT